MIFLQLVRGRIKIQIPITPNCLVSGEPGQVCVWMTNVRWWRGKVAGSRLIKMGPLSEVSNRRLLVQWSTLLPRASQSLFSGCLSLGQLSGQIKEWTNMEIASGMLSKTLLQNGKVKVLLWKRSLVHSKESRYSQWSELCRNEPALALPLRTLWFRRSGLYYRETKAGILMVSKTKKPSFL